MVALHSTRAGTGVSLALVHISCGNVALVDVLKRFFFFNGKMMLHFLPLAIIKATIKLNDKMSGMFASLDRKDCRFSVTTNV